MYQSIRAFFSLISPATSGHSFQMLMCYKIAPCDISKENIELLPDDALDNMICTLELCGLIASLWQAIGALSVYFPSALYLYCDISLKGHQSPININLSISNVCI